jgi:hypothetical protein
MLLARPRFQRTAQSSSNIGFHSVCCVVMVIISADLVHRRITAVGGLCDGEIVAGVCLHLAYSLICLSCSRASKFLLSFFVVKKNLLSFSVPPRK